MTKATILAALLLLSGCATQADLAERERLREEENARVRAWVNDQVRTTCAYAEGDRIAYGECDRQTRMFLFQQHMQFEAQLRSSRPSRTECRPSFNGSVVCTTD